MFVVTLGDLLLDVVVRLDEPLAVGADALAETQISAGGQAANVAAWVVAVGGDARCVTRRGEDTPGVWLGAELTAAGMQRMASRVFAALLVSDTASMTSADGLIVLIARLIVPA